MNKPQPKPSQREKEIFFAALDQATPEARAAYLEGACGDDLALRRSVAALLRVHFGQDSFMAGPALDPEAAAPNQCTTAEKPGDRIGRYKLREKIGEGGCGVVYVAEQEAPVRRLVALKLICLKLGRKEEAPTHARAALRYMELLTARDPNNAEFAMDRIGSVAQLGEAHLALFQPDGLDRLQEALTASKGFAVRDPANTGAILNQIIVLRYFVQGLTAYASDPAATVDERRARLDQTQAHLNQADKLTDTLRAPSARKAQHFEFEPARADLAAARVKLEADANAQPKR